MSEEPLIAKFEEQIHRTRFFEVEWCPNFRLPVSITTDVTRVTGIMADVGCCSTSSATYSQLTAHNLHLKLFLNRFIEDSDEAVEGELMRVDILCGAE